MTGIFLNAQNIWINCGGPSLGICKTAPEETHITTETMINMMLGDDSVSGKIKYQKKKKKTGHN